MRIAVILEGKIQYGGAFQQELATALLLNKKQGARQFIFYVTDKQSIKMLNSLGIEAKYLNIHSIANKIFYHLPRHRIFRRLLRFAGIAGAPFETILLRDDVDLIYFLVPSPLVLFVTRINYVTSVLDLCHRDHPEFPEVSLNGVFEDRENIYRHMLARSVAVLTSSESIKADIVRRYGCDAERVCVVKFLPSVGVAQPLLTDVREKYALRAPYIFYPAQFWAHKNHVYILDGLRALKDKFGVDMEVVFSGFDAGNLSFVLNYAQKLGLQDKVRYVGFVSNEEVVSFYKQAVALVMPTYFGPTNIPPLEAFALECPVCYPDLPGLRDEVLGAAFLMDLDDPESMARHMMTILHHPQIVQEKIKAGKQLLSGSSEDDFWGALDTIFDQYARKMRCWKDS